MRLVEKESLKRDLELVWNVVFIYMKKLVFLLLIKCKLVLRKMSSVWNREVIGNMCIILLIVIIFLMFLGIGG